MQRLFTDEVLLVRAMWLICEEQADKDKVSAKSFGKSMFGDPLEDAYSALQEAVEVFLPPLKRGFWKKAVKEMMEEHMDTLKITIEEIDKPENRAKIRKAKRLSLRKELKKQLTRLNSATDSPGSPELTRGQKR